MEVKYCRDFLSTNRTCTRENCKFEHDTTVCKYYYNKGNCKHNEKCKFKHVKNDSLQVNNGKEKPNRNKEKYNRNKVKNTECFEPMSKPVDMRVVVDTSKNKLRTELTSRDVLLVPNLFSDFAPRELYSRLVLEIENSSVPKEDLLKMWHGNDKIDGTHLIANDHTHWKNEAPTFNMIIERIKEFFDMDIKATRFNWYKDTSQWKPFHFDAAKNDPKKAAVQNFTVAVSFGATRDCAFEKDNQTKDVISFPIGDGEVYCFAKDTNCIWRHGVLQDTPIKQEGRISVICWGFVKEITEIKSTK
jgi:hypothetical protein